MMTTCNGHYLSFFWCHTLVNRMQLGLHWCVAGRCPVRTKGSKVLFADKPGVIAWWFESKKPSVTAPRRRSDLRTLAVGHLVRHSIPACLQKIALDRIPKCGLTSPLTWYQLTQNTSFLTRCPHRVYQTFAPESERPCRIIL